MCSDTTLSIWRKDREGEVRSEGKIEGRGTWRGVRPGLHVGWRGTRLWWRGAARERKSREEKHLSRASPHRLRWSAPYGPV
jgi:hypothetical protein